MNLEDKISGTALFLNEKGIDKIDLAIVAGTGLGNLEDILVEPLIIRYNEIPHFPVSTVEGHNGRLVFGKYAGKNVLILSGRFHYYEGYEMSDVTYYVHVVKSLGAKELIITNASGGVNQSLHEGQIVLVKDHINLFPQNPLRGLNYPDLGPMFPDMLYAYPKVQREKILQLFPNINEVVYIGWSGPNLETPAEYKMAQILGADIVGMSTVPEVIVAKYRSLPVLVLSVVSNVVSTEDPQEADIASIISTMHNSGRTLVNMIQSYLEIG
jgi:purine-nucleoside phosphorylase